MSQPKLLFVKNAFGGGYGWFEFDPEKAFGWSFEEAMARIYGLAHDQDPFQGQDRSVFDFDGVVNGVPFGLCDWKEDRCLHIFLPNSYRTKEPCSKKAFIKALKGVLSKAIPKEFETNYSYSTGDVLSWPTTPSKADAVAMAVDALNGLLSFSADDMILRPSRQAAFEKAVASAKSAHVALLEAF